MNNPAVVESASVVNTLTVILPFGLRKKQKKSQKRAAELPWGNRLCGYGS